MLENAPFIGDVPMKSSIYRRCSIAMFVSQRVYTKREDELAVRITDNAVLLSFVRDEEDWKYM